MLYASALARLGISSPRLGPRRSAVRRCSARFPGSPDRTSQDHAA